MNLPINKEKETIVRKPRVYKNNNMYYYSPFKSDHELMDRIEQKEND